jgi:hypothetical protein
MHTVSSLPESAGGPIVGPPDEFRGTTMAAAPHLTDDELDVVLAEVFGSCWDQADTAVRDRHRGAARRGLAALDALGADGAGEPAPGPIRVTDEQVDVVLAELFGDEWGGTGEDVHTDRRWELRYGLALVNDRRMPRAA